MYSPGCRASAACSAVVPALGAPITRKSGSATGASSYARLRPGGITDYVDSLGWLRRDFVVPVTLGLMDYPRGATANPRRQYGRGVTETDAAEPAGYLSATRAAYDTVAADYADLLRDELAGRPVDRALLAAFADLVRLAGDGPVAEAGCGPGRVTAHLAGLGVTTFGVGLSGGMLAGAGGARPATRRST